MKSRFSSLDVSASIAELSKSLVGLRLQNIYDINAKTYLFKFSQKDLKILILIESGVRIHSTSFVRDKSNIPSGFCMKLRKHLRTRRLTALTQLGTDRVVDFKFGEGEYGTLSTNSAHHVIVELYDSGNIIFTGPDYGILSLLRIVELDKAIREADDPRLLVTVGRVYDTSRAREFSGMTREKLMEALRPFDDVEDISLKKKTRKSNPLKNVFRIRLAATYGTALLDHILSVANVDPNLSDYADLANSDLEEFNRLYQSFLNADQIILDCSREPQHGYIYTEQVTPDCADYSEFHPFLTKSGGDHIEFPSFDSCVDEYFSKIETQRFIAKARHAEVVANKKIEKVRESHANQLNAFAMTEESKALIAQSIEGNLEIIDATLEAIRNFMKSGLSWDIMKDYFENEKMKGNPASKLICGWNLEKSQVILSLSDLNTTYDDSSQSDESDGDYNSAPRNTSAASKVEVAIDINCTAYANARTYYSAKKVASKKAAKTKVASSIALEFAERKIAQNLQASQQKAPTITKVRYAQWFEKFNWFISSENYLIIGSHDKALIQLLVDQYMEADDVFVFADIDGASSVLIKNTAPYQAPNTDAENPVPPTTVREAGMLCLSQSKAWDSKIVTSAFWFPFTNLGCLHIKFPEYRQE